MAEIQPAGVRGADAVGVGQNGLYAFQLIIQLVQCPQKHADPILIQKCHLIGVLELDAGHTIQQTVLIQLGLQLLKCIQPAVLLRLRCRPGFARSTRRCRVRRLRCLKAQLIAGRHRCRFAAVQSLEPLRLCRFAG